MYFRQLHSTCCIIIAITALADIIHQLSHVIFSVRFFLVDYFTTLENCFCIQFMSAFAMNFGSFTYFSCGVDRLLCVLFPSKYQKISENYKFLYLIVMLALPTIYSALLLVFAYMEVETSRSVMVVCFITDIFHGKMQNVWNIMQWTTFASTVGCYCVLWLVIRLKNGT